MASQAEIRIAEFIPDLAAPAELPSISPEHARRAGAALISLCENGMLQNLGSLRTVKAIPGSPLGILPMRARFPDKSGLAASIRTRTSQMPGDHPARHLPKPDTSPYQAIISTKHPDIATPRDYYETRVRYYLDPTGAARKKIDIQLAGASHFALAGITPEMPPEEQSDVMYAYMAEKQARGLRAKALEEQLGYDGSSLVGRDEVAKVGAMLNSMELGSFRSKPKG